MLRPCGDRVLVKPNVEEEKTAGGIVLPDTAKERPQWGEVIAVGAGKWDESGKNRIPMKSRSGIGWSLPSTAEPKSRWTEKSTSSSASPISSRSSRPS